MAATQCRACLSPLSARITAELAAGVSIRQVAAAYKLSVGSTHRHLAHLPRGGAASQPSGGLEVNDDEALVLTEDVLGSHPRRAQRHHEPAVSGPSVDVADKPHVPKFLKRMMAQQSNIPDHRLERAVADVERLENYVADLAAPIADVIVEEGREGLYSDWAAVPYYERRGYDRDA